MSIGEMLYCYKICKSARWSQVRRIQVRGSQGESGHPPPNVPLKKRERDPQPMSKKDSKFHKKALAPRQYPTQNSTTGFLTVFYLRKKESSSKNSTEKNSQFLRRGKRKKEK